MDLRALSLCAGIGAHDIALRRWVRTVGYVERDAFAAACLVEGMAQEILDPAPVWDDLCTFDGRAWRGVVDLVSAGIPCQPYSVAGKRKGNDDERALWPELVRIVRECLPAFVFIENTPEFLTHAEPVWRELRGLGFEWEEPLFVTASHVGAIHRRRRVFLLAAHAERLALRIESGRIGGSRGSGASAARDVGDAATDADGLRECEPDDEERTVSRSRSRARGSDHVAPHTDLDGLESEWCGWVFDGERQTFRHDAERCGPGCRTRGTHWDSESPVCRVDAGPSNGADSLRVLGNAVPPQQTEQAFRILFESACARIVT